MLISATLFFSIALTALVVGMATGDLNTAEIMTWFFAVFLALTGAMVIVRSMIRDRD